MSILYPLSLLATALIHSQTNKTLESNRTAFNVEEQQKNRLHQALLAKNQLEWQAEVETARQIFQRNENEREFERRIRMLEKDYDLKTAYPLVEVPHKFRRQYTSNNQVVVLPAPMAISAKPPSTQVMNGMPNYSLEWNSGLDAIMGQQISDNFRAEYPFVVLRNIWKLQSPLRDEVAARYLFDEFPSLAVAIIFPEILFNELRIGVGFWFDGMRLPLYGELLRIEDYDALLQKLVAIDTHHLYDNYPDAIFRDDVARRNGQALNGGGNFEIGPYQQRDFARFLAQCCSFAALSVIDSYRVAIADQVPYMPTYIETLSQSTDYQKYLPLLLPIFEESMSRIWTQHPVFGLTQQLQVADALLTSGQEDWAYQWWQNATTRFLDIEGVVTLSDHNTLLNKLALHLAEYSSDDKYKGLLEEITLLSHRLFPDHPDLINLPQIEITLLESKLSIVDEGEKEWALDLQQEIEIMIQEYKDTLARFKEHTSVESQNKLEKVIDAVSKMRITITAFGAVNAGKSSLLSSMMGLNGSQNDNPFTVSPVPETWDKFSESNQGVSWESIEGFELILRDTPGLLGNNPKHLDIAKEIAMESNIVVFVVYPYLAGDLSHALIEILSANKPVIVVINKMDILKSDELAAIEKHIIDQFDDQIPPQNIVHAAAAPTTDSPQIHAVVERILDILKEETKFIVSQPLEQFGDKFIDEARAAVDAISNKKEVELERDAGKQRQAVKNKKERAMQTVANRAVMASGAAGLIPFFFDAVSTTVIANEMVGKIAEIYELNIAKVDNKRIAAALTGTFAGVLGASWMTLAAYKTFTSGLQLNPFTYVLGMTGDALMTYFIVYVIGDAFSEICANGVLEEIDEHLANEVSESIKRNFDELFWNKLPKGIRKRIDHPDFN